MTEAVRKRRLSRLFAAALAGWVLALGCGTPLPGPPTGPHRAGAGNDAIIVQGSPPPVQVECVPPQPREECVWVDGSWAWAGRRWEWLAGAWLVPPAGCYHAHAYAQWLDAGIANQGRAGGRLFYFPAAWYPNKPGAQCKAPKICVEATPIEDC